MMPHDLAPVLVAALTAGCTAQAWLLLSLRRRHRAIKRQLIRVAAERDQARWERRTSSS